MMILVPAIGVPSEEMLQDTLKSAIVAIMTLIAGWAFCWFRKAHSQKLALHGTIGLPLMLALYALGSMLWSHPYLAGVEAVRWLLLSALLWLGTNIRLDHVEDRILPGIHWGVTVASLWTALQFWGNFHLFPQGPGPASTFINRNFFAEYAICALPYSAYLLLRSRDYRVALGLAAIIGFNVVALLMTGTRSAILSMVVLAAIGPMLYVRCRRQCEAYGWNNKRKLVVATIFLATVASLGSISSKNSKLIADYGPMTAISRAVNRTVSVTAYEEYTKKSFSVRFVMWAATARMILHNPIAGVGAGGWEYYEPLYQAPGNQLETDYYAHNEFLQLVAEYGLVGWAFLGALLAYIAYSFRKVWVAPSESAQRLAPMRACALSSLVMLLLVANAGFPLRMAGTCAFFALNLSILAACDLQGNARRYLFAAFYQCKSSCNAVALVSISLCILLAGYATHRAAECERSLIRGIQLALTIEESGNPNDPYWTEAKVEMLQLLRRGIALNGHYRKITPIAADELAKMGDWEDALWIWKSVYQSRPYIVAILSNIARADLELNHLDEAQEFIEKALRIQPSLASVRSLNAMILFRKGDYEPASKIVKGLFNEHAIDHNLTKLGYLLGERTADADLAIKALEARKRHWPSEAADSWLKLGHIYAQDPAAHDEVKALQAYRSAVEASQPSQRTKTMAQIPPAYRSRL